MKIHNRQIKGSFWSDPDLIYELSREQRMFYIGLTQLAEDSGCLEYDTRSFKIILYPADIDITPDILTEWTEIIIRMGKLVLYEAEGKKYLYIKNFAKHQSLRTPAAPEIPLPPWVKWVSKEDSAKYGEYIHEPISGLLSDGKNFLPNDKSYNRREEKRKENRKEEKKDICENLSADAESLSPQNNQKKEAKEIMDFYNQKFSSCWSSPLKFTTEREKHIRARLKNFSVDDLKKAIVNLRASPFHCGENDKGKVYATPEFLFKNDSQVDKWLKEITMKGGGNNGRHAEHQPDPEELEHRAELERIAEASKRRL